MEHGIYQMLRQVRQRRRHTGVKSEYLYDRFVIQKRHSRVESRNTFVGREVRLGVVVVAKNLMPRHEVHILSDVLAVSSMSDVLVQTTNPPMRKKPKVTQESRTQAQEMRLGNIDLREPRVRAQQRAETLAIFSLAASTVEPHRKTCGRGITKSRVTGYIERPRETGALKQSLDVPRTSSNLPIIVSAVVQVLGPAQHAKPPLVRSSRV
eukprot:IDg3634t1